MYEGSASPQGAGGGGSLHEGHQAGTQGAPSEGAPEPSVWTPDGGTEPADPPADPGNAPSSCAGGESGTGVSVHPESGGRQADYDRHRNGSSEDNGEQL